MGADRGNRTPIEKSKFRCAAADRGTGEPELVVAAWAARCSAPDAVRTLQRTDVARSKHLLLNDEHPAARGYWQQIDHPELGVATFTSSPYLIDGKRVKLERPLLLSKYTDEVLRDLLGCGDDEINKLKEQGVFK